MAAPPVSGAKIGAALAAVKGGATLPDAAKTHGVSLATLKRYRSGKGAPLGVKGAAATSAPKAKAPALPRPMVHRPGAPAAAPPSRAAVGTSLAGSSDDADDCDTLLETLHKELKEARAQRRKATEDAARRGWSKRVQELIQLIDRLAPAPPIPPDEIQAELRAQDGAVLARIEIHQAESITLAELVA